MNENLREESIDELLEGLDLNQPDTDLSARGPYPQMGMPFTFWLPLEYKTKYDALQERTKKKFGKIVKEILKRSINKSFSQIDHAS